MTRSPRPSRKPAPRDGRGLLPSGTPVAAIVSIVGLLLVAVITLSVSNGQLPFGTGSSNPGTGPGASDDPKVIKTPTPPEVVVVPTEEPGVVIPGTLVYAKDGNIWLQADGKATQLTKGGRDSMPSFEPDGSGVIFVRTRPVKGLWSVDGSLRDYDMEVPSIMHVDMAGGSATRILDGLVDPAGRMKWMGFIREPVVSPNGTTIAMASDLPDPTRSDVSMKLLNRKNGKITDLGLAQVPPLGHQDPAWRPDGQKVAYVMPDRDGAKGTPRIYVYTLSTKKAKAVTGPGYLHPAWSPDGRYLAATRTSAFGTDVVILDASTGAEIARVTNDGHSWAPAWSPAGNQIAYLHVAGQVVDLRLVQLEGSPAAWQVGEPMDLTSNAGLDGTSRPGWFIPADQLPAPTGGPAATEDPAASPSGS